MSLTKNQQQKREEGGRSRSFLAFTSLKRRSLASKTIDSKDDTLTDRK